MTALQPIEDHKSCPLKSPLFSKLNSPSAPLKIINLAYLSTCLSPKSKRYFTTPAQSSFQHNGPTKTGRCICPIQTWHQERFNSIWDPQLRYAKSQLRGTVQWLWPSFLFHQLWLLRHHCLAYSIRQPKIWRNIWDHLDQGYLPGLYDRSSWGVFYTDTNGQRHSPTRNSFF